MSSDKYKQKYDFFNLEDGFSATSFDNRRELHIESDDPESLGFKTPKRPRIVESSSSNLRPSTSSSSKSRTPSSIIRKRSTLTSCPSSTRTIVPSNIVALAEGRGLARGEMGIASIDLKNPELILSQFPDAHTYVKTLTKLNILQPLEVIIPNTTSESGSMSGVLKIINEIFPKTNVVLVQRQYFNEIKGIEYIRRLGVPECKNAELLIADKYYALAAAAALIKYVEYVQNIVYAAKSLKIEYAGGENTTMIDINTCTNLELLLNMSDPKNEHTLFGVLHFTKTVGGTRLLRANILQPPFCYATTTSRLDCVQELLQTEDLLDNLKEIISKFIDVDHLLSLCVQIPKVTNAQIAEHKINNIIHLKHTLELVEPLSLALENAQCPLLIHFREMLKDTRFEEIYNQINEVIIAEAKQQKGSVNKRAQRSFAVKSNINGLLDLARKTYAEIFEDITNLVAQLSESTNLPLRLAYTSSKGFIINLPFNKTNPIAENQLPPSFVKINKNKSCFNFITEDLINLNNRAEESLNEIFLMSDVIVTKLLGDITQHIGSLYKLTEAVTTLDLLLSYAQAALGANYVRPEFTDTLAIKNGRHPVLDRITEIVANNTFLNSDENFNIITGPNMSGKSTFLKQILLLQIMAQIGSYVPAEYASFRLTDHIYSRAGSSDDIETNTSTFMMEMKEMNYITNTITDNSLVVIDELGRGTSVEEGIGVCQAICEHLIQTKAFVLFATHFDELTNLNSAFPNVSNYFFDVESEQNDSAQNKSPKFRFLYVMKSGKSQEKSYGITLTEMSLVPQQIIENAKKFAKEALKNTESKSDKFCLKEREAVLNLSQKLHQVSGNSTISYDQLKEHLETLLREFQAEVEFIIQHNSQLNNCE